MELHIYKVWRSMSENVVKAIAVALLCFVSMEINGQSIIQRNRITGQMDNDETSRLIEKLKKVDLADSIQVVSYAEKNGLQVHSERNGKQLFLRKITQDGTPLYYITHNLSAAQTTATPTLWSGGLLGLDVQGENMNAGIWDGGAIRSSHVEFNGRITSGDGARFIEFFNSLSNQHATHVAGTMIASGVRTEAKGMAPAANLTGYDWNNDDSEMAGFAAEGNLVSNHSYGLDAAQLNTSYFGYYDDFASSWDEIAHAAPYYLIVKAGGNDRGYQESIRGHFNPVKNGYDLMTGASNAKNVLTVAAVNDVEHYNTSDDVVMTSFSSWGPTDDGRIKPDIAGNGMSVTSPISDSNNAYDTYNGTSMAAPNISGSLLLLQQLYSEQNEGRFMKAATLKGLVTHTASEAGRADGPDYEFGWGLLNLQEAARAILNDKASAAIEELTLRENETITRSISSDGRVPLIVSIAWTDPAAQPGPELVTDDRTPKLVNDLDIRLEQEGNSFAPWILDPQNPSLAASTGDNFRDNIEQIKIMAPQGSYELHIRHKGSLLSSAQDLSLIITGIGDGIPCTTAIVPESIEVDNVTLTSARATWLPDDVLLSFELRYRLKGSSAWTYANDIVQNEYYFTGLTPETGYEFQVRSFCGDQPSSFTPSYFFETNGCQIPEELIATNVTSQSITLTWEDMPFADGYLVSYKRSDTTEDWKDERTTVNELEIDRLSSGISYDFRLQSSCSNHLTTEYITRSYTINCSPVESILLSEVTFNTATFDWESIAGAGHYQVRYREVDQGQWTEKTIHTDHLTIEGLLEGTVYELQVRSTCSNGHQNEYLATKTFSTYCHANGITSEYEWIEQVRIGDIDNVSGKGEGYQDFSHLTTNVSPGRTLEIGLTPGNEVEFPNYWQVWIDFNRDGDFLDFNEEVISGITHGTSTYQGSIDIPEDADLGKTRMRVTVQYNKFSEACGEFDYGEVEDYSITIGSSHLSVNISGNAFVKTPDSMILHPNPSSHYLNVNLNSQLEKGILEVLDLNGKNQLTTKIDQRIRLDTSGLDQGMYILIFRNQDTQITKRFVKINSGSAIGE